MIAEYVQAIYRHEFNPNSIYRMDEFLCEHEGKTLFEHMAAQPQAVELMNSALLRAAKLIDDASSDDSILNSIFFSQLLGQLYEVMGRDITTAQLNEIAKNPLEYLHFFGREEKALGLRFHEWWHLEGEQPRNVREAGLRGQIAKAIKGCDSLKSLLACKMTFEGLLADPLFTTHDNGTGALVQTLSSPFTQHLPAVGLKIKEIIRTIDSLNEEDLSKFKSEALAEQIRALLRLHRFASEALQKEIAGRINQIVLQSKDETVTHTVIESGVPYPVGKRITIHGDRTPCILSQLSPEANLKILNNWSKRYTRREDKALYQITINNMANAPAPISLTFNRPKPTERIERELTAILGLGNFPNIKSIEARFSCESEEEMLLMLAAVGSEKMTLRIPSGIHRTLRYTFACSAYPRKTRLKIEGYSNERYSIADLVKHGYQTNVYLIELTPHYSLEKFKEWMGMINVDEKPCDIHFILNEAGKETSEWIFDGKALRQLDVSSATTAPALSGGGFVGAQGATTSSISNNLPKRVVHQ